MHTFISVGFTTAQWQSMTYITTDPEGWVQNVANVRAGKACKEITDAYTEHKLSNDEPINISSRDEMVAAAFSEGIVITAEQQSAIYAAEDAARAGIAST